MADLTFPTLPPGYSWRKPGELWDRAPAPGPNDADVFNLTTGGLAAFVTPQPTKEPSYVIWVCAGGGPYKEISFSSMQEAIDTLAVLINIGEIS